MFGMQKCRQHLLIPAHKPIYVTHYDEYNGPPSLWWNFKEILSSENFKHINFVVFEGPRDVTVQQTKLKKKKTVLNGTWA